MPSFPTVTVELGRLTGWMLGTSLLGTNTYLATYTYTDITNRTLDFHIRRGRQHELDRIETGVASLALINQDGAFTPTNTASPYYPDIRPMIPLRIRASYPPPQAIPGLAAWYDFSDASVIFQDTALTTPVTSDGQAIKGIADKSGQANHITEATNGPTYKVNIQNGRSVARFDGTNDQLSRSTLTQGTLAQPGTVFCVAKTTDNTLIRVLYDSRNTSARWSMHWNTTTNWFAGSSGIGPTGNTAVHVFVATFNGASSKLYIDGGSPTTANVGANSLTGITLGAEFDSVAFHTGDIEEMLIYSNLVSLSDINSLGSDLATRWGTTWTTAT